MYGYTVHMLQGVLALKNCLFNITYFTSPQLTSFHLNYEYDWSQPATVKWVVHGEATHFIMAATNSGTLSSDEMR